MRDISQITDQELLSLLTGNIPLEDVKNILSDPAIYDNQHIKEQDFSYHYADALRNQIEFETDSEDWKDQHFENLIQGELTARNINFWIKDPKLIFTTTISTSVDKTVEKFTHWVNTNKQKIIMVEKFIKGEALIKTDQELNLDIDVNNTAGININDLGHEFDIKLYETFDTQWISDDLSVEQKNSIAVGFLSGVNEFMEGNNWTIDHVDLWFYGPIDIVQQKKYIDV